MNYWIFKCSPVIHTIFADVLAFSGYLMWFWVTKSNFVVTRLKTESAYSTTGIAESAYTTIQVPVKVNCVSVSQRITSRIVFMSVCVNSVGENCKEQSPHGKFCQFISCCPSAAACYSRSCELGRLSALFIKHVQCVNSHHRLSLSF